MRKDREEPGRPRGNEAAPDDLGGDPRQVGPESAGPSGDPERENLLISCFLKQFSERGSVLLGVCLFPSLVGHDSLGRRRANPLSGQGLYGLDCRELLSFFLPCHARECEPRLVT